MFELNDPIARGEGSQHDPSQCYECGLERGRELEMDARVANKYGPEPVGTAADGDGVGVVTRRTRWPRQAGFQKGDRVVLRPSEVSRHHHRYATAHIDTVGIVVGFSREQANYGYSAACGGNKIVVHWLVDDTLGKVRVSDLKLEEVK
jgi:hypothetical protein